MGYLKTMLEHGNALYCHFILDSITKIMKFDLVTHEYEFYDFITSSIVLNTIQIEGK